MTVLHCQNLRCYNFFSSNYSGKKRYKNFCTDACYKRHHEYNRHHRVAAREFRLNSVFICSREDCNNIFSAGPEKRMPKCSQISEPRSKKIAESGINTSREFASFMSALIGDIMGGSITPQVANAAINAGGKLLKVCEMEARYGRTTTGDAKTLKLVG